MDYSSIFSGIVDISKLLFFLFVIPILSINLAFKFDAFKKWFCHLLIKLFNTFRFDRDNNYHFSKNIIFSKGRVGEILVNFLTLINLDMEKNYFLKHVTLATADGTTQIDHILLSPFGIFVIETKNMKGWIFGSIHQKVWTQKIFNAIYRFQNPEHQNYKHKKTLQELLNLADDQLHSVVVFTGDCEIKTPMPDNIVKAVDYIDYIKSKKKIIFTNHQLVEMCEVITKNRLAVTDEVDLAHSKHTNEIKKKKEISRKSKKAIKTKNRDSEKAIDNAQEDIAELPEAKIRVNEDDKALIKDQVDSPKLESSPLVNEIKTEISEDVKALNKQKQLHQYNQAKQDAMALTEKTCSRCGSAMVKRVAKKGENKGNKFWGCSTYPKCRKVEPLEAE